MQWRSAVVGKATFDLGHLWPFEFVFEVAEKAGKRGQSYRLFVEFGMHCFTRGIKREERYGGDRVYRDSREERLFDEEQYNLSFRLPDIIRTIGTRRCFHTGHGNFFTIELMDSDGNRREYSIYFKVSRKGRAGLTLFRAKRLHSESNSEDQTKAA
jgi:hypothetical protein